ncbi:MAG TPA: hypothetical protein VF251_13830 [Pyrinomonadaceae bacterium]
MRRIAPAADVVGCSMETDSVEADAGLILVDGLSVESEPVPL